MKKSIFIPVKAFLFIVVISTAFCSVAAETVPQPQPDNNTVMINPHDNRPPF